MKRKKPIASAVQIVSIMLISLIPLLTLLIGYNFYSVSLLNKRMAQTSRDTVLLYQRQLEQGFRNIDSYLTDFITNNKECQQLRSSQSVLNTYLLGQQILENYRVELKTKEYIAGLYIYSANNNLFQMEFDNGYTYNEKTKISQFVQFQLQKFDDFCRIWSTQKIDNKWYLFRFLRIQDTYCICVVDANRLPTPQKERSNNDSGFLFYVDEMGNPITGQDFITDTQINVDLGAKDFYTSGEKETYLLVQNKITYGKMYLVYAVPSKSVWENIDLVQTLFLIGTFLMTLLIVISFMLLNHSYIRPLNQLLDTMDQIQRGNLDAKMETSYTNIEFCRLGSTFNNMMNQIRTLKIASYEQKLEIQQERLQYLQIQIRPHFFLNCLKNLYGLAQQQQYLKMQDMILALSEHLRYMLRENAPLVPVENEIRNVENYILLQQMSAPCPPSCSIELDQRLKDLCLPPLSLLTFVENSVKYNTNLDKSLQINIKIHLLESDDGSFVNITIQDSGGGFSEEILQKLNKGEDLNSSHIGIQNVQHRFALLYCEQCTFSFFNLLRGACIEIFVPYDLQRNLNGEENLEQHDSTDCR